MTDARDNVPLDKVTRDADQEKLDASSRRRCLAELVAFCREQKMKFVDVVELANALGVDQELDDLVAGLPERHRRKVDVTAVRLELGIPLDELAESPPERH